MTVISTQLPRKILNSEGFELNLSSWQAAGLVGWWPLGAYPDARNMSVYGSARPNATNFAGGAASATTSGAAGQRRGLFFDGSSDYLMIPNYPQINNMANATLQFWMINAIDSHTTPFSKDGNTGMYIQVNASSYWSLYGTVYSKYGSAVAFFDKEGACAADTWYLYTMVFNDHDGDGNGTISMYRDGVALAMNGVGAVDKAVPTGMDDPLFIGQYSSDNTDSPYAGNYYTDGYLDDMRIYNRALSANEVAAIYHQTRDGGYGDLAAKPQRFWNIPFSAEAPAEPTVIVNKQADLVEGPSSKFDVVTEIRDERRGATGRGVSWQPGPAQVVTYGTRSDPSTQAVLDRLDNRFVTTAARRIG